MLFSNKGLSQVSGNPMVIALDLANILRAIQKHSLQNGGDEDMANSIIVFAGRLSSIDTKEQQNFLKSIPLGSTMDRILELFEDYMRSRKEQ